MAALRPTVRGRVFRRSSRARIDPEIFPTTLAETTGGVRRNRQLAMERKKVEDLTGRIFVRDAGGVQINLNLRNDRVGACEPTSDSQE